MQLQNVCRICLEEYKNGAKHEMEPIFDPGEEVNELVVVQEIKECFGIELQSHAELPQLICHLCLEELDKAFCWRRMCISNEVKLMRMLQEELKIDTVKNANIANDSENAGKAIQESGISTKYQKENELHTDCKQDLKRTNSIIIPKKIIKSRKETDTSIKTDVRSNTNTLVSHHEQSRAQLEKEKPKIMCEICGNIYDKRNVLKLHMHRHLQLKPHKCELCSKAFASKPEVHRHMRVHTGARPFSCKYCSRTFSDLSTVHKHERTHTNERPYACQTCGKSFVYAHVLKDHMLTHTGERPHRCQVCNKTFARIHLLKQHYRTITHRETHKVFELAMEIGVDP